MIMARMRRERWGAAGVLLAICMAFALVEAVQLALRRPPSDDLSAVVADVLLVTVPPWFLFALLTPAVLWLSRRFPLVDRRARALEVHVAASLLFPIVHLAGTALADALLRPGARGGLGDALGRMLGIYYVMEIPIYWLIVGADHAWVFNRRYRASELEAARVGLRNAQLEAGLAQAKLQALSGQLQPHFLFNTLNSVVVLARQGRRRDVIRMITRLSDLLRTSIHSSRDLVTLREEASLLRRYLGIERVRFQDRLSVRWSIAADCLDAEVPSFLLQPLAENAVRHGIARSTGPVRISIRARRVHSTLRLWVRDSGPGLTGSAESIREGVGLRVTRERLEQLYGPAQSIHYGRAPAGGFQVTISIPLRLVEAAPVHASAIFPAG